MQQIRCMHVLWCYWCQANRLVAVGLLRFHFSDKVFIISCFLPNLFPFYFY